MISSRDEGKGEGEREERGGFVRKWREILGSRVEFEEMEIGFDNFEGGGERGIERRKTFSRWLVELCDRESDAVFREGGT